MFERIQEPITKHQTERLIAGALIGFQSIAALNGASREFKKRGGLYTARGKYVLELDQELEPIIQNTLRLSLDTRIGKATVRQSKKFQYRESVELMTLPSADHTVDAMAQEYTAKYEQMESSINQQLQSNRALVTQKARRFKDALGNLRDSYKGTLDDVEEAVGKVKYAGLWSTTTPIYPLFNAVVAMEDLAHEAGHFLKIEEAQTISDRLNGVLQNACVKVHYTGPIARRVHKLETIFFGPMMEAPDQYQKWVDKPHASLSNRVIAEELMRLYH